MRKRDVVATNSHGTLTARLRMQTAPLHAEIELLLGLPSTIQDRKDYCRLLERFFGLYAPLERSFQLFDEWESVGLDLRSRNHAHRLSEDLTALGTNLSQVPHAPDEIIPELPTFAHALGALYVLEGSTLGGRIILRDLEARVRWKFSGATQFLNGRGAEAAPMWMSFRAALDSYGCAWPQRRDDVVSGAEHTYSAIVTWFTPFCELSCEPP
jgi:heme oxygenase (biliverdin-IX-beta and delta-forming)